MKSKAIKIIGVTALFISLMAGFAGAISANSKNTTDSEETNPTLSEFVNFLKSRIDNLSVGNNFIYSLNGTQGDIQKSFKVTTGYPNIKLDVQNIGKLAFRIEVKHNTKHTVIFQEDIPPHSKLQQFINNDDVPLVPPGDYTVTIYGGGGKPKGDLTLKSSNTRW